MLLPSGKTAAAELAQVMRRPGFFLLVAILFASLWALNNPWQQGGSVMAITPQLLIKEDGALPIWASQRGLRPPDEWKAPFQEPQGLQADSVHVRVVIRTHHRHRDLCRSLIYALHDQANWPNTSLSFHLVPTEPGKLDVLQDIQNSVSEYVSDVRVLDLPDSFFERARVLQEPYRCTEQQREAMLKASGPVAVHKWCDYDNHVYYQATDVALEEAVKNCPWCTHVIVTNSDNGYNPGFLEHTLDASVDMAAVSFIAVDKHIDVSFKKSFIDLGSVLLSRRAVDITGGFISALPAGEPHPVHPHDADWHFLSKAESLGLSTWTTQRILFYHH